MRREHGASAVEYALMVAAIAAMCIMSLSLLGQVVNGMFIANACALQADGAPATTLPAPAPTPTPTPPPHGPPAPPAPTPTLSPTPTPAEGLDCP